MTKNCAYFDIPLELLADSLRLPDGTSISRIQMSPDRWGVVRVVVEGEGLPLTEQGELMTRVNPQYKSTFKVGADLVEFQGWGI